MKKTNKMRSLKAFHLPESFTMKFHILNKEQKWFSFLRTKTSMSNLEKPQDMKKSITNNKGFQMWIPPCWKMGGEGCWQRNIYGFEGRTITAYGKIIRYPEKSVFSQTSHRRKSASSKTDVQIAAYRQITSYLKYLLLSDKSQAKPCQLLKIISLPYNKKQKNSGKYYFFSGQVAWPTSLSLSDGKKDIGCSIRP